MLERVRCMIFHAKLPKSFWGEAVATVAYLINRSLDHLSVFGCLAYAHVKQGKLEPRAKRCLFIGYPTGVKGYKLWNLESGMLRTMVSRDVTSDENSTIKDIKIDDLKNGEGKSKAVEVEQQEESYDNVFDSLLDMESTQQRENEGTSSIDSEQDHGRYNVDGDRQRISRPPIRYSYSDLVSYALSSAMEEAGGEPLTYEEAVHSKDSKKWLAAMQSEMESLRKNETWILVDRPLGKRVVGCKWLYKIKKGAGNDLKPRYKTRLVAWDFTQVPRIDFNEVFSHVVRHTSFRVLLAITTHLNLNLDQMDVATAFLHGELEESILMEQPKGFETIRGKREQVCLLKKFLCGLKQSPRQWYKKFNSFMLVQGYKKSSFDCYVYFKYMPNETSIYLLLYADCRRISKK